LFLGIDYSFLLDFVGGIVGGAQDMIGFGADFFIFAVSILQIFFFSSSMYWAFFSPDSILFWRSVSVLPKGLTTQRQKQTKQCRKFTSCAKNNFQSIPKVPSTTGLATSSVAEKNICVS
jgi:hypothetical protein